MTDAKPTTSATASGGVDAVDRALSIVGCFQAGDHALSLTEIAARTGLYKSTILRLTVSLEKAGYLVRHQDKSYRLGPELLRLGGLYQRSLRLEDHVRPVLRQLMRDSGESASFFRREGAWRICAFREDSTHAIRDHVHEGDRLPLERGAAGHVLTRFADGATLTDIADLPLLSFGEREAETGAAAVPVFSQRDGLIGALTLSGPLTRFTPDRVEGMKALLLNAGRRLSETLGGAYPSSLR
ncbi:IclR family transcriptional regulator [Azospirillum doebereinerae]